MTITLDGAVRESAARRVPRASAAPPRPPHCRRREGLAARGSADAVGTAVGPGETT
ncbi:hypothetical protein AB1484_16370 [Parafrankia sp. FMc6]|uniref:hypothetical protein n=1 Tax=Parafrankia soli TaxID=2599596 RepID=UPI0034D78417